MRGSVTLDFIFSLVLLIVTTSSLFFAAYTQIENTMVASTQMKAEAMAMSIGSSINHFAAVQPADGSTMTLKLNGIADPGFALFIGSNDCNVTVATVQKLVIVNIAAHRMESSTPELITAQYPIVSTTDCVGSCGDPEGRQTVPCDGSLAITKTLGQIGVGK